MADSTSFELPDEAFAKAAADPSSFSIEGLSQSNRSLSELISLDKYLRKRSRAASGRPSLVGLFSHAIPPGTCDR